MRFFKESAAMLLELFKRIDERWNKDKHECAYLRAANTKVVLENQRLLAQLPESMKHCAIVFEQCEVGHGSLRGANWVKQICPWCEIKKLRKELWNESKV